MQMFTIRMIVHSFASFPPLAKSVMCYISRIPGFARGGGDVVIIITSTLL